MAATRSVHAPVELLAGKTRKPCSFQRSLRWRSETRHRSHLPQNAEAIAQWLRQHPKVSRVSRPLTTDSLVRRYLSQGAGAVFTFDIAQAGRADCGRFIEALELFQHVVNIGDTRSLIVHPASTTHASVGEEGRLAVGITNGMVRISVGLEHPDDIVRDVEQALERSLAVSKTFQV